MTRWPFPSREPSAAPLPEAAPGAAGAGTAAPGAWAAGAGTLPLGELAAPDEQPASMSPAPDSSAAASAVMRNGTPRARAPDLRFMTLGRAGDAARFLAHGHGRVTVCVGCGGRPRGQITKAKSGQ
jgi:hypothetical protein